ncbi:uncharacterized protein TNCV_98641 [Trichonephila clavipes]|nr:uncharacterized protein TNCV_98641 [Trichonephila clavipes]
MQSFVPLGLDLNPGEGMDVCKYIGPSRHGATLNNHRAASALIKLVEGEERWESPDQTQGFLLENWDGIGLLFYSEMIAASEVTGRINFYRLLIVYLLSNADVPWPIGYAINQRFLNCGSGTPVVPQRLSRGPRSLRCSVEVSLFCKH